jgi:hypothetical protein
MNLPPTSRYALAASLALLAMGAMAGEPPPPFEGRLDEVAVASRRITVSGVTYPLAPTVRVQGQDGRPATLRAEDLGRWVQVVVAAPDPGKQGPAPVLVLTLINQ